MQFLSKALVNYGRYILAAIAILYIVIKYMIENNREFKYKVHQLLLRVYLIKGIILFSTLSRFTLVFSELVRSGIHIADTLGTAINMTENLPMNAKLATIRKAVEKGSTLHEGLEETGLFENMVIQMIAVGEESGSLDEMSGKVADFYEADVDDAVDNLSSLLEPMIMAILGVLVGGLVVAMYLPIFKLGAVV